jgi:hypothetical protein
LPPLVGHELAHLIHFNQRTLVSRVTAFEELWLSEAMAHLAEDTISGVLRGRGLTAEADAFARENLVRALFFLRSPEKTSLIASTGQATLEERGAGWLFLKYLNQRVGGGVLRRLQTSPQTGANSVTTASGIPWMTLMRDWAIAVYASGATDIGGITLPREQTLGGFDLRTALATISSQAFPLAPTQLANGDFSVDWKLAPSSTTFSRLTIAPGAAVNLVVAGDRGGDLDAAAQPQILLFRIR